jgi:8-oxo-dGTP diphosphatase
MGGGESVAGRVLVSALAIIPGPDETVTFVRQERGPYAGWWLLPGGKVEFGEPIEKAARREAAEESGCVVGEMLLTGAYEIFGPDHHYVVWTYRGKQVLRPPSGFAGHHVTGVRQARWDELEPHPTDLPILNDAGAASYAREVIAARLTAEGITMRNLLDWQAYGTR